ncbi:NADPH-dependent FMN reductase [Nonomuraea salmonea]|uniref:NADPH-dependent FMN reductase n=1 Tax=Nonomuraea salmonea TaxID=46181 RepID=UPI0031EC5065
MPPAYGQYQNEHTKAWAAKIRSFDGFVMVTPEYNHSTSGGAEERHRLPVRGVEQQGVRHRVVRQCRRRPRGRAPAADRR